MKIYLVDEEHIWKQMLPLTFTRAVGDLRMGIFTLAEKWAIDLEDEITLLPCASSKLEREKQDMTCLCINSHFLPNPGLINEIKDLNIGESLWYKEQPIAYVGAVLEADTHKIESQSSPHQLQRPWDLFLYNAEEISHDVERARKTPVTFEIIKDPYTAIYETKNVWVESGADVKAAIINAEKGPVYIGQNAKISEGAIIIGPAVIGDGSVVNPGAKIRPGTTIGPYCKVGGEISNSILWGYSNKGHDGFLGNAVIGQWCNLGADTNCSNLKNDYGTVKVFSYAENDYINSEQTFCGLIMGDHSKSGINTMFNTGTVVGVSCNIFGEGFPAKHIPSFTWGPDLEVYRFDKAIQGMKRMMERRGEALNLSEEATLKAIFEQRTTGEI